jgi:exopolysaccharide biosynthesis protein
LGKAMKSRGVQDAVSLDGGGSTCLFYQGSLVVPPQRKLSNLFVLSRKADPYEPISASAGP